jgi:chromosomal replication initiation ATPase DnaA
MGLEDADPTVSAILDSVANFYNVTRSALLSGLRWHWLIGPRAVAMYLVRERGEWSYPSCGRLFRVHHTSVYAAYGRVVSRKENDPALKADIEAILQRVGDALKGPKIAPVPDQEIGAAS